MILVKDLNDLEIGDWIKIYPKEITNKYYKIGEITHKWIEGNKPHFQLKIIRTSLPTSTEKMIERHSVKLGLEYKSIDKVRVFKSDRVYRLNKMEKTKIIKELIVENLK